MPTAMLSGPTLVVNPNGSASSIKILASASENTVGPVFWSDGMCETPHVDDEHWLRKYSLKTASAFRWSILHIMLSIYQANCFT